MRNHNRAGSWGQRLVGALTKKDSMRESKSSLWSDERVWYDQFTSTDWVHDSIADAYRVKALRSRTDIRGRIKATLDGAQGWILSALVGCATAIIAYGVDVSEAPFFDWKDGYCHQGFFISEKVSQIVFPVVISLCSRARDTLSDQVTEFRLPKSDNYLLEIFYYAYTRIKGSQEALISF
jgi:hypothetical protein